MKFDLRLKYGLYWSYVGENEIGGFYVIFRIARV